MMKKGSAEGNMYDIYSIEDAIETKSYSGIAVEYDGIIYPKRLSSDTRPGLYVGKTVSFLKPPEPEDESLYKGKIIDFSNAKDIRDIMDKTANIREIEAEILTSNPDDNIYVADKSEKNTPVMAGFKHALEMKKVDTKKYEGRLGPNPSNDLRLLKGHSITLDKLEKLCKAFDMNVTIVIEDKNDSVPNPINDKIVINLIEGDE